MHIRAYSCTSPQVSVSRVGDIFVSVSGIDFSLLVICLVLLLVALLSFPSLRRSTYEEAASIWEAAGFDHFSFHTQCETPWGLTGRLMERGGGNSSREGLSPSPWMRASRVSFRVIDT